MEPITLVNLHKLWTVDTKIDDTQLDLESKKIPLLHSKYLNLLTVAKLQLQQSKTKQKQRYFAKLLWYKNKSSDEDLENRGFKNRYDGPKLIDKHMLDAAIEADEDLCKLKDTLVYHESIVTYLENIMKEINARNWNIKNIIDVRKFESGII